MAAMRFTIRSETDLIKAINKYGFLPFFRNTGIIPTADSGTLGNGKVRSFKKQAVHTESSLNTKLSISARNGFPTLQTIVVTVMTSMQGTMRDLQSIPIKSSMICLTVTPRSYPKN